jgi:chromate reductase, NAD(P)H dehydrogenase (quinone)
MKTLFFITGSLRAASSSRAFARALAQRISDVCECRFSAIGALPHYNADVKDHPEVEGFKAAISEADGLVVVTPEYNYGIPGVLKNAIDWASRPGYESVFVGKPAFIITTSGGIMGGVRAQGQLKYVLSGMLANVYPMREVIVPHANRKVEDGVFTDEANLAFAEEQMRKFIGTF